MGEQDILFSKLGSIAHITINRAEALNALNDSVLTKLDKALDDIEKDPAIVVAVITGAGSKAFIAGADVKEIKEAGSGRTAFITANQTSSTR
jgi:enoyl-CoA hydratase/carnithine racemase